MSDNSKRTKKLLSETVMFAIGSFGSRILSMLLVPFYTSILTTAEYGTIDFILTIITLIIPLFTLSIQDAVFLFAMEKGIDSKKVFSNSILILLFSFFVSLVSFPLVRILFASIAEYHYLFLALFISTAGVYVTTYYLKGTDRTRIFAIQGVIYTFSFSVVNIYMLAFLHMGINGYLSSQIIANVICIIFMICSGKLYKEVSIRLVDIKLLKKMLMYSAPLIPASVAWFVMSLIDKYMLLNMCSIEANGLYSVANKLPSIITVCTSFFTNAWQIAALRNKNDSDVVEYSSSVFHSIFSFGLLLCMALITASKFLGYVMFANDFFQAWTMVPALAVSTLFSTLSLLIGAQFTAAKRSDLHLKSNIISLVTNVILNYILIKCIGALGAAIGTMMSYYIVFTYRQIIASKCSMMNFKIRNSIIGTMILIASAIITGFEIPLYQLVNVLLIVFIVVIFRKEYYSDCCLVIVFLKNKITK